ncbi:excinuclease ABC, A subunit [Owenweeksia hongkongensis DSM 17368]|uniref:UvrABC system protein A n=1 Tax=Owenweeksia hongkongensis (strain DSM 17368 / CIP 108786 / JCM 12287 / NRRL B-23963 / UST20020801) TaxID=926562 RepID=G8R230_OWEHD|nr:excinuclease ABC subunit UvrA [Owenweeksia hongkongensis]AEV31780.1 excinuclease ABC, A subunit [Owenweeksia hongkongensis DSM 17368]
MSKESLDQLDPRKFIIIKGAKVHNLKGVDVAIPHKKLTVITGLSGSGKSSLAFDTLYAEGQRRYVESLSSYARQFLGRLDKPEVEYIKGISPAVAIEQKVISRNPRSTVGTTTEIYDYLKVLYARIGKTFSPISGKEVKRHEVRDVIDFVSSLPNDDKIMVKCPLLLLDRKLEDQLGILEQQGYSRVALNGEVMRIDEMEAAKVNLKKDTIEIVIDRLTANIEDQENQNRLADSVQTAFFEGHGTCVIENVSDNTNTPFSNKFEEDGIEFEEPSTHLFSFNNPFGACPKCEGFGSIIGIDEDLVIPDSSLSLYQDAVVAWKGEKMSEWRNDVINGASKIDFPIHKPYFELSEKQKEQLWEGTPHFKGLNEFFKYLESKSYKIQYRVMLSRYRGKTKCDACKGTRLRKETNYVKVNDKAITELVTLPIDRLAEHFAQATFNEYEAKIAERLITEITSRINYLQEVGLGYLTLNRVSNSLSGGESQRINLATSLGSALVGSTYILDEPSIGLHPRDTERLIGVVQRLRDLGNTVVVVEHDEEMMLAADHLIDIGPAAGSHGGNVMYSGPTSGISEVSESFTAQYLSGQDQIDIPLERKSPRKFVEIKGARENNLKNIDVNVPLHCLTVVTGVSGSGKSTLISKILYPALKKRLGGYGDKTGKHTSIGGDWDKITEVEFVDQNPIGKSSRSNPVTYIKAYDDIRALYASQPLAKARNYKSGHFSFNIDGGRCDKCQGEGEITIEMQFMADVHLKCDECHGQRFKQEILDVKFQEKTIFDILELTVEEAIEFFTEHEQDKISQKLQPLLDVGLSYVTLGQSSSTLSGGEAQRIKLATFLGKGAKSNPHLFIFDEPTTGLHFHDIKKLLNSFYALIQNGHSIVVIEHHPDVIKCADWVIDLGPEGGENGGNLVYEGTPEGMTEAKNSYTAPYILEKLEANKV